MSEDIVAEFGSSVPVNFYNTNIKIYDALGNQIIEKCGICGEKPSEDVYINHLIGKEASFMVCNKCSS